MIRHLGLALFLYGAQGIEESERAVALRGGCQVESRLGEMESALGQTDVIEGLGCRGSNAERRGIGEADVFTCQDQEATKDVPRILAGVDHLGQPVKRRVRI